MEQTLEPIQLHPAPGLEMDDDSFFLFCQANSEYRIERTSDGDIVIMSPEAASSGHGNFRLSGFFIAWEEMNQSGTFFSSSTGFILPNGAMRSPDIAWVKNTRLAKISDKYWNKFLPLCPDFVLELRSPTDRLATLQEKMQEYIENGTRLGWLLDPSTKRVHVYSAKAKPVILENPSEVAGDPVLPRFRLPVPKIWAAVNRPKPR